MKYERAGDLSPIEGFVLVGGASSRMGRDKAELLVGGKRLFERAVDSLALACNGGVRLVGSNDTISAAAGVLGIATLADLDLKTGIKIRAPLIGLYSALRAATSDWIAILACDLPFVSGGLLIKLAKLRSDEVEAIVPIQTDGRPQPLCALYKCSPCLARVQQALKDDDLKLQTLLSTMATCYVKFDTIDEVAGAPDPFLNINNPSDHQIAVNLAKH